MHWFGFGWFGFTSAASQHIGSGKCLAWPHMNILLKLVTSDAAIFARWALIHAPIATASPEPFTSGWALCPGMSVASRRPLPNRVSSKAPTEMDALMLGKRLAEPGCGATLNPARGGLSDYCCHFESALQSQQRSE